MIKIDIEQIKSKLKEHFCKRFIDNGDSEIENCINNPHPNTHFPKDKTCNSCQYIDTVFDNETEDTKELLRAIYWLLDVAEDHYPNYTGCDKIAEINDLIKKYDSIMENESKGE